MPYSYSKLRGRIIEKFGSVSAFANEFGLTKGAVSLKLHGKSEWTQTQIQSACLILEIPNDEIGTYFFDKAV